MQMYSTIIPARVINELGLIAKFAGAEDNWMVVKKLLLRSLPPVLRKNFSTRHPKTKLQSLNEFERNLIDIYKGHTGIELRIK